jgi:hypothetical protein
MSDPTIVLGLALAAIAGLGIAAGAALKGWREWLEVKQLELETRDAAPSPTSTTARIEIADLKERVRRLEAIATGVDM